LRDLAHHAAEAGALVRRFPCGALAILERRGPTCVDSRAFDTELLEPFSLVVQAPQRALALRPRALKRRVDLRQITTRGLAHLGRATLHALAIRGRPRQGRVDAQDLPFREFDALAVLGGPALEAIALVVGRADRGLDLEHLALGAPPYLGGLALGARALRGGDGERLVEVVELSLGPLAHRGARQALPLLRARGDRRFRLRRLAPDALDTLALLVGLALEPIALRGRRGDRGRHRAHLAAGALADLRRQALEPLALRRRAPDRVLDGNEIGGL